jgi:hypothetical protein
VLDEQERTRYLRLLQAAGMAEAVREPLDAEDLAREMGASASGVRMDLELLSGRGLLHDGLEEALSPMLLAAGHQFLARRGEVDPSVLRFLPRVIDDLNAREALLTAGTILVDEFRAALLDGDPVDHAKDLVPPAFVTAVDHRLAVNLFAASVALMARLSSDTPAGCVAEEIIAVNLIEEARALLEAQHEAGELTEVEERAAATELRGLFELFEDDDVMNLFAMLEPADAALAEHDPVNYQLGVADQRLESWFAPFGGTAPTGYLNERPRVDNG